MSHRFLSDEIQETRVTSVLIPSIFLGVTAFLIHLVLGRLVGTQRDQIAVLKAFGYTSRAVAGHYVVLALAPVAAGCALGAAVGLWFAAEIAAVYADFFQFPEVAFQPQAGVVLAGMAIGLGAGVAGALGAARRVLTLPPAEAMRPEAPARFRPSALERGPLGRRLTAPERIIVRHLYRRPVRALLSIAGLAAAGAILVVSPFFFDAVDRLKEVQFEHVQREEVTVAFREVRDPAALDELRRLPGVQRVEPYRAVDARLSPARWGHRTERVALTGLSPTPSCAASSTSGSKCSVLRPPVSCSPPCSPRNWVSGRATGSRSRCSKAGAAFRAHGRGHDRRPARLGRLSRPRIPAPEAGGGRRRERRLSPRRPGRARRALRSPQASAGGDRRRSARGGARRLRADDRRKLPHFALDHGALRLRARGRNGLQRYPRGAFGARPGAREPAGARVSRGEVATLLLGEQAILTLVSIPVGLLGGYGLCWLIALRVQSELFRIPMVVTAATPVFAAATVLGAAVASGLLVYRRLCHLDLVAVLKTRE